MERLLNIVSYESPGEPEPNSDPDPESEIKPVEPLDLKQIGLINSRVRSFRLAA